MEPIDRVNYVIVFLLQTTKRYLTFLLASLTVTLTVLLLWIYFFSQTLVFVPQWPSVHWEILIMLLSQLPLILPETLMTIFIAQLMTILVLI